VRFLPLLLAALPFAIGANEKEIQRALIQRDQQSAEFSNRALERVHARQRPDPAIAPELRPYERSSMAREREAELLRLSAPVRKSGSDPDLRPDFLRPLPLPGGPRHGVDPIPAQGLGG